ncbi:MAG: hypothetical protein CMO47_06000 [Verrucomicrobiales bacterium]|nr:hypothetical protein [Verrucomicrobiales bacterium]|tara:strand:+ start:31907 stop:33355 length:1449 start_codon:yes stop_codon:yes gene_type:complete
MVRLWNRDLIRRDILTCRGWWHGLIGAALILAFVFGQICSLRAHPVHTESADYPFVIGFERFYSSRDDDDYLARGGLILLNELNCVACHEPPNQWAERLAGVEATNLHGVGTRLDVLDLEMMIRNPRFVKKDTSMPSMFAGSDRDLGEVEALKHYLSSLKYELPPYPRGNIEAGRQLYHRIGCVACHAPEVGFRPEGLPENAEIELAGLPSTPMNLVDLYDLQALTHFLLGSNEHRPSGRMPDYQLGENEAADLAAYLKAGPDLVLPDKLAGALKKDDDFRADKEIVAKGRELFVAKNCVACHALPGQLGEQQLNKSKPLLALDTTSRNACMSERPSGGAMPFYGMDEVQKRAISLALERMASAPESLKSDEVDWRMKQLNCYACHERDGVGGVEAAREVYFRFEDLSYRKLGREGHLPPSIDHIGGEGTKELLRRSLSSSGDRNRIRPHISGCMPVYGEDISERLIKAFEKAKPTSGENAN